MPRMVHVSTLLPMASGEVGLKEHTLMSEFSILMPPPTIDIRGGEWIGNVHTF